MLAFICYFFPAVFSVWLFETLTKRELSVKKSVYRFCTNALIINFICLCIKRFILFTASNPIVEGADMLPSVALKYMIMAVGAAAVIAVLEVVLFKKTKIAVEDNTDESEKK